MRPMLRYSVWAWGLLGLAPLAEVRAQIQANEVVYVRQIEKNRKPHFQMRARNPITNSDRLLFEGCHGGIRASYCAYLDPVVSPDGNRLVFVMDAVSGETCKTVWISGVNGARARQISSATCFATRPSWSADGRRIAYESQGGIYVISLCEANLPVRGVATGYHPAFAGSGDWIVFMRDGNIHRVRAGGTALTRLTSTGKDAWPRWTKPGTPANPADQIVFISTRDGPGDLYMMDVQGGNVRRITSTASRKASPDVALLPAAFVWQEGLNVMFKGGTNAPRVLTAGRHGPVWGHGSLKVDICP